jgi:glycosyltransferase involved in cell wall biosynthesis
VRAADALVLAAAEIGVDVAQVFKTAPAEVAIFGVAADVEAVRAGAQEKAPPARNAAGEALLPGERTIVGMCGHASARKGADIFLQTAAALPDVDFLWIGGWRPEETPDNVAYADFNTQALPNLYIAGSVDNPYPYMQAMDLFFLSSREDPNPVVIAEAAILGVPVLCFSRATAIGDRLGRSAIVCYGAPNAADAARVIGASATEALRSPGFRETGSRLAPEYDLKAKMDTIRDLIARLRETATAPERAQA